MGKSERTAKERISEHRGYIYRNKKRHATGEHFNKSGYSLANMTFTILEIVRSKNPLYRKEREAYNIRKLNTYYKGIIRSPGGS